MEREIKFKFIIDNKHISKEYTLDEIIKEGIYEEKILQDIESGCDGNSTCQINGFCDCDGDFENSEVTGRIQYTGLKDKNDKEIYEGDIVRHKTYGYSVVKTGVVRWIDNETRFTFDVIGTNEKLLIDEYDEVIGNIYENPELLNKESK